MLNPSDFKDGYKDQESGGFDKTEPVSGIYDVVNVKLQHQKVGQNATRKLRVITRVLKVVTAEDQDGSEKMVSATFGFDLWWDLSKKFNAARLVYLGIACGETEAWDPTKDQSLIQTITGIPYRIKIDVEAKVGRNGRTFYNVNPVETKHLSKDVRKRYMESPDWKKIVGSPDDRMLDPKDYSSGAGPSADQAAASDPFSDPDDGFADDDLPF